MNVGVCSPSPFLGTKITMKGNGSTFWNNAIVFWGGGGVYLAQFSQFWS